MGMTRGKLKDRAMGHKCFISFKTEDAEYKRIIQEQLNIDMVDKSLDVPINSENEDYIMRKIREDYLSDSTVTIHLIGLNSAENLGEYEQRYIKRELQSSLFNGEGNTRNGLLGVVLPEAVPRIYGGVHTCSCGKNYQHVAINDGTVVREFSHNFYIDRENTCHWTEEDRYAVLVPWDVFVKNPNSFIDQAFDKRFHEISNRVTVRP